MFRYKNYVLEIYKEKSFSKAAQNLYISQPSLSATVKKLEERLSSPIFDRSTSPIRLTSMGEVYVQAAEEIVKIEKGMENYINDINTLHSGNLSIGASNVFAAYALPSIITEFKNRFPGVNISLYEGNTATLEEMLSSNRLDLVIDNNHYDSALYDKELYAKELLLLAVPNNFEVCEKTKEYQISEKALINEEYIKNDFPCVPLEKFSDIPFIMLTPNNDTRMRADKLCKEAGFRAKTILELNQQATAYMTASTRMGAVFVSDMLVSKLTAYDNLVYYKLSGDASKRTVYFYYKKRKYKARAMEEFIKLIHEY
ncbi:MAG: LysR family transcriptional regulator [Ruminococcaceae bacterium]|nr:LysR family transcriptional regulator [Oscillospiraceae bacterium]